MSNPGRIPPQAIEAEEYVLGLILLDRAAIDVALEHLKPDDFYKSFHRNVFEAAIHLHIHNQPVDLLTVEQRLKDQKINFGPSELPGLTTASGSSQNMGYYCQIIKEKAYRRSLIHLATQVINDSYQEDNDVYDVIDQAQSKIFGITEFNQNNLHDIAESLQVLTGKISLIQEQGRPMGMRTGLDLDKIIRGWQDSRLYIIGARPSMGKTAFVMSCMRKHSKDGHMTGLISIETSHDTLACRLVSLESGIPAERIMSGEMTEGEYRQYLDACATLSEKGILIDDSSSVNTIQLRSKCRNMKRKGVDVIFIDFLTLIKGEGSNRHQEVGEISKTCKAIAKDLEIPVVVLAQLSRSVESRADKRPMLSDLRESGSIEEDADVILFLYRDEYYGITTDKTGQSTEGVAEIIVAKNKDGKTGFKKHYFSKETMAFKNLSTYGGKVEAAVF